MPASDARRIVLVLHDFSGGGSERVAIRLANSWAAAGRTVTIVCGTEAGPLRSLVGTAVTVCPVRPNIVRGPLSRRRLGRAVGRVLRSLQADVVVGPGNFHVLVLRAIGLKIPVVCKLSNPLRRPGRTAGEQWVFDRTSAALTRRFARLVAMSPALAGEARAHLRRDIDCIAEPNVADDWVPPPRRQRGPGPARIVCAGRLVPQKDFARALRTVAALDGDWRLDLLGDGPGRVSLQALSATLGIADRVRFAGHVADTAPYLAAADVLLCTSSYEGYPAVLVEALAAGVPVVTTACSPAVPEILCDPSFGVVAAAEAGALAAAIRRVVAAPRPDPVALERVLSPHRAGQSAAAWLRLLDEVVAGRG